MFKRFYAAMYDKIGKASEAAGLSDQRQRLLARASGETIEIGAGTGLNLPHYPEAITRLVLVEPDPHMTRRLRQRVAAIRPHAEALDATAAQLPFPDDSFDTALVTLCSVSQWQSRISRDCPGSRRPEVASHGESTIATTSAWMCRSQRLRIALARSASSWSTMSRISSGFTRK